VFFDTEFTRIYLYIHTRILFVNGFEIDVRCIHEYALYVMYMMYTHRNILKSHYFFRNDHRSAKLNLGHSDDYNNTWTHIILVYILISFSTYLILWRDKRQNVVQSYTFIYIYTILYVWYMTRFVQFSIEFMHWNMSDILHTCVFFFVLVRFGRSGVVRST